MPSYMVIFTDLSLIVIIKMEKAINSLKESKEI